MIRICSKNKWQKQISSREKLRQRNKIKANAQQ